MLKNIMTLLISILAVMVLSHCVNLAGEESTPAFNEVAYQCEQGSRLSVRFYLLEPKADLIKAGVWVTLTQESAASGFYYTNAKMSIRGKGDDLSFDVGRMAPIHCQRSD